MAYKYKRALLKLSGEHLAGSQGYGIDPAVISSLAQDIKELLDAGKIELAITLGGGNIFRGLSASTDGMDRSQADYIGMLATIMNALALKEALGRAGVESRVQSAIEMHEVAETYIRDKAIRHLQKGRVVLFAAGTGNPFFTTDSAAALRACEINADVLIKATQVDGVYSADPKVDKTATKYDKLTYLDVLTQELDIMDSSAISLCKDNNMHLIVCSVNIKQHMLQALQGEKVGTLVT